jgi:hypothetical protein
MAAPDFSAAAALSDKALQLSVFGHFARAAEKYGQALDAARAQRCPDCLIVARLELDHAGTIGLAMAQETLSDAEYNPRRAALFARWLMAGATLQRRKAAGTLLGTSCTATELAWQRRALEHSADLRRSSTARANAPLMAAQLGFDTLIGCASNLLADLMLCMRDTHPRYSMTAEQLRACCAVIADAADCMAQPRACESWPTATESIFAKRGRDLLDDPRCTVPHDGVGARLREAWQRMESSGVLQRRGVEGRIQADHAMLDDFANTGRAAAAAPGLRTCGLPSCSAREQHPAHFKSCAACRIPAYCSKEHQTEHWPSHKAACKAARKAAAADTDGGAGPSSS